ncbi:MAG: hypothetical protein Q8P52_02760 [bacterium]|nr:hypothetical protein [bacterium]
MYLHWDQKTITDFSPESVEALYNNGYVFTRLGKGVMHQTRSARIDLSKFELSSENRRILKKCEGLEMEKLPLPLSLSSDDTRYAIHDTRYSWPIGKMAKDFYQSRGAEFSANKVKELLTDNSKSNFNCLLRYTLHATRHTSSYAICYDSPNIFHYSYPFYDINAPKDTGLGMMLLAIQKAKEDGRKYFYIGSLQRHSDTYKLQFEGMEWFDGNEWNTDMEAIKKLLDELSLNKS